MTETKTKTPQTKEGTGKVRGLVVGLSSALGLMTAGTIFLASGALGVGPTTAPITTPSQVVAATATPTTAKTTNPGTGNATTPEQSSSNGSAKGTSGTGGTSTDKTGGSNSGSGAAPAVPAPAVEEPPAPPAAPTGADSTGYVRPEVYLANVTCEAVGDGNFRVTEYWAVRGGNHNGGRWSVADGNGISYHVGPYPAGSPLVYQGSGGVSFGAVSMNGSGQLIDVIPSPSMPFIDAATKCH